MSIDSSGNPAAVLKINLIWTENENAYIGYEQVEGFTLRKYSIRLTNGVWTIFYEDDSTTFGTLPAPIFTGGTSETSISEMSELLPVPISSSWISVESENQSGGFPYHSFVDDKSRVSINTSSSC